MVLASQCQTLLVPVSSIFSYIELHLIQNKDMVLQRAPASANIWGWAAASVGVTVVVGTQVCHASICSHALVSSLSV